MAANIRHRLERSSVPTVRSWREMDPESARRIKRDAVTDCGWGRLLWGHTFEDAGSLAEELLNEEEGRRDIAFYLRDPHVVLSLAPDRLFLDPSHTYRLWFSQYQQPKRRHGGFVIRRVATMEDAEAMNRIYASRGMVQPDEEFVHGKRHSRALHYFVAEDVSTGEVIGTITGVDHTEAFRDPENGSSFWCLGVDTQAQAPGVGEALVRHAIEYFQARGRDYMDLSVMHDNVQAIGLYEKLGFKRVPVFAVKVRNPINEPLFTPPEGKHFLNPYADLVVKEARRRGVGVRILDEEKGLVELTHGGRSIVCWESLSELTSAIAFVRCDDKALTRRTLAAAGIRVPEQTKAGTPEENTAFLNEHGRVVVKPRQGEQGAGITVDVRDPDSLEAAVAEARKVSGDVLLERFEEGDDLRLIVIGHKLIAAAVRKPARILGTGRHTARQLIEKQSRRRGAATGGESSIPMDAETERCLREAGYGWNDVVEQDEEIEVRKTANLHTGGTIHDVTPQLHPELARAAEEASRVLDIPVVGFDFMVPEVEGPDYVVIEANERPGLANHEPQPTAEAYLDLLFPQTAVRGRPLAGEYGQGEEET